MSTSDQVRAILGGTIRAYQGEPAYGRRPEVFAELDRIGRRIADLKSAAKRSPTGIVVGRFED